MGNLLHRRKAFQGGGRTFAYSGSSQVAFPGVAQSNHSHTLIVGEKYAGIANFRYASPNTIATDQGDTVTLRGSLTGGSDGLAYQGFEFVASAVATSIEVTALLSGGTRGILLWQITGYDYENAAGDPSASGPTSVLSVAMNTLAGDIAICGASWASGASGIVGTSGIDTLDGTILINTRMVGALSASNLTAATPLSLSVTTDAGWKAGAGYFMIYR